MAAQDRRGFLRAVGLAAAALPAARVLGANERVNLAVIGLGGRGRNHINEYAKLPGCRITAVCDIDQKALDDGAALVEKLQQERPKIYGDMRKLFADRDVDAVSLATPNHWHALGAIWACQAGKDVYVEKPACHNLWEGRKVVEAARKYQRIVQVGSQSRSIAHKRRAMQLLQEGVIGKLYLAKGLCYKRRPSIGRTPDGAVPAGVNWDMFLGPAPMRPFNPNRYKYNWHWFWDTGNGDIGNQGVHEMDIALWGMNLRTLPKSVVSTGGKFIYDDDQETPNTQLATFDYGSVQVVFEVRGLLTGAEGGVPLRGANCIGNIFYGSEGFMAIDVGGFQVYKGEKRELVMDEKYSEARQWDTSPHMANFLNAVRSRKQQELTADVELGVTAAALCHLANISYRTGRKLNFDAAAGRFVNDPDANRLLTREYRSPYIVPDKV
jgi:predicted dehydrogenase